MPRFIVKFADDQYIEWSTVVDAPITYLTTRQSMLNYLLHEYGHSTDQEARLKRADEYGTSCMPARRVDDVIEMNRAGENETRLTREQIIENYAYPTQAESKQPTNPSATEEQANATH